MPELNQSDLRGVCLAEEPKRGSYDQSNYHRKSRSYPAPPAPTGGSTWQLSGRGLAWLLGALLPLRGFVGLPWLQRGEPLTQGCRRGRPSPDHEGTLEYAKQKTTDSLERNYTTDFTKASSLQMSDHWTSISIIIRCDIWNCDSHLDTMKALK
ncbi:uncharacterized protein LOC144321355 [Canis aureus]